MRDIEFNARDFWNIEDLPTDTVYDLDPRFAGLSEDPPALRLMKVVALAYFRTMLQNMGADEMAALGEVAKSWPDAPPDLLDGLIQSPTQQINEFETMVQLGALGVSFDDDRNVTVEMLMKRHPFPEDREVYNRAMRRQHATQLRRQKWRTTR